MCRERAGAESETKPLPGHAIFARAIQADVGSARLGRGKQEQRRQRRVGVEWLEVKDRAV